MWASRYERVLFQHPDPDVFMLECPDFFPIKDKDGNEKWVIGFWVPSVEPQRQTRWLVEQILWDCGHNYYAPQSFNVEGRQIVYGWMSPFVQPIPMEDDGWCGQLTLPRDHFGDRCGDRSPKSEVMVRSHGCRSSMTPRPWKSK